MTYPILLDVSGKRIVIIGGGAVALRKAIKLIEAGAADITVVSPSFTDGFPDLVRCIKEAFRPQHLAGAEIVFAATDSPQVNELVIAEARRLKALACRSDEEGGDFTVPAVLRKGAVTVAVSAESPALAAAVRDKIAAGWDRRWTNMAEAMRILRPMVLESGLPPERRRELLRELASDAAMDKLATEGIEGLRKWIETKLATKDTKGHEDEERQRELRI
jgi:precorrin-2 dehydrogenase/sirohydrochlorin ferrochelatase